MSECSDPVRRDRRAPTDKTTSYARREPTQRTMFATISSGTRIDPAPSPHRWRCPLVTDNENRSVRKPRPELRIASRSQIPSPRFRLHIFPLINAYTQIAPVGSCANMQHQSCGVDFRLDLFQVCALEW